MRLLSAILFATLSISNLRAAEISRIVVDDEHLQMQRKDGSTPSYYIISSGYALEIDASQYEFRIPDALKISRPNSVQIILGGEQNFSAKWPTTGSVLSLSESTLSPNPGSQPFKGFQKGQEGVIAIGVLDNAKFSVIWAGMFRVQ